MLKGIQVRIICLAALSLCPAVKAAFSESGYRAVWTVTIVDRQTQAKDVVELLVDDRLNESLRNELWGKGDWTVALAPSDPLYKDFSKIPPATAKLALKNNYGKLLASRELGT